MSVLFLALVALATAECAQIVGVLLVFTLMVGPAASAQRLVHGIEEAPDGLSPIEVMGVALESAAEVFGERDAGTKLRQDVVAANPELQERDLVKMAMLAVAAAGALRGRGVADPAASLAAEAGIAVLKVAYQQWVNGTGDPSLREVIRKLLAELRAVAGSRPLP